MARYFNQKITTDYKKVFTIASLITCLLTVLGSILVCYFLHAALVRLVVLLLENHATVIN